MVKGIIKLAIYLKVSDMQTRAWPYQMIIGSFLIFIGESSMIQGIISMITNPVPAVDFLYVEYTLASFGTVGMTLTLIGICLQIAGILLMLGLIGKKARNLNTSNRIPLTA